MVGGCASDGVGRVDFVVAGGLVVVGVVVGRVDVVVGDAGVVDTTGLVAVVVGRVGIVVVVVVVGTSVVEGSADTVTVLGSAVTVTVDVSVGGMVTVTVEIEVEATVLGSCAPDVSGAGKLTVAEKLALTDIAAEFSGEASAVTAAGVSGTGAVLVAGSVASAVDWAVPGTVAVSAVEMSPGTGTSLGRTYVVLVSVRSAWLGTALYSEVFIVDSDESGSALFVRSGGLESALTMSVIPIAVVTNAVATPAYDVCRRNRSGDGAAALLSTVRIQLLLSPSRRAGNLCDRDFWGRE
ncbi:hypothetical protein OG308_22110 [Nocardia salmonicida]|uniref:Uncharacterized protein n=1 Tax=Nocardia salmonicida TaxID=53431 RepID=A0ABZ1N2D1_9NOCA|nr:hypothetical protein [Nocardia salmonicida]